MDPPISRTLANVSVRTRADLESYFGEEGAGDIIKCKYLQYELEMFLYRLNAFYIFDAYNSM